MSRPVDPTLDEQAEAQVDVAEALRELDAQTSFDELVATLCPWGRWTRA